MHKRILAAVILILILPSIADIPVFGAGALIGTSMQDYIADPGVVAVYQECSSRGWPIVARLGTVREPSIQTPNKRVLFLFIKDISVDIHLEYFRTPQGRYVVLTHFPLAVVDKSFADFIKK